MERMYRDRLKLVKDIFRLYEIDAGIVLAGPNMFYLSGYTASTYERLLCLFIPTYTDEVFVIAPKLEGERITENIGINPEIILYRDHENPIHIFSHLIHRYKVGVLGIEGCTPYRYVNGIEESIGRIVFKIIDEHLMGMRVTKSEKEISYIRKAAEINVEAIISGLSHLSEGVSERFLSNYIREKAFELGADDVPFTIVQSGPNTSKPHERAGDRSIKKGDPILFDIGVAYRGYVSDITRTVVYGEPSKMHTKVFDIVKRAQARALEAIRPGIAAREIDERARNVIESEGFGKYFIHRTGHGIGIEVHEEPYITSENEVRLSKGMVFTVEPGIYLPGKFGIRIEDDIAVTKSGHEILTIIPKSLYVRDYGV
jgi:Xaa-Pro aminopeptidase